MHLEVLNASAYKYQAALRKSTMDLGQLLCNVSSELIFNRTGK